MLGHLAHLGRAAQLLRQLLGRAADRERAFLQVARYAQGPALVAEVALQLAEDGRRRVARELRAASRLEAVDRLDQAEAGDLYEVVQRLVGVHVAEGQLTRERQEALAELLARGEVALLVAADQQPAFGRPCVGAGARGPALHAPDALACQGCGSRCQGSGSHCEPLVVVDVRSASQPLWATALRPPRSEEHTSELQSLRHLVCRLLL